jgi:hypothetical protein
VSEISKSYSFASQQGSSNFLIAFASVSIALAITIVTINAAVDPYGLISAPKIEGINAAKPRMFVNARMVKAHQLRHTAPHGLVLGSSRAETGIDPDHPGWLNLARPIYNAALPSARIFEIYHYLRHAHAQNNLVEIVLGLDFFMFDTAPIYEKGFDLNRLDISHQVFPNLGMVKDIVTALYSYDALSASLDTLTGQIKVNFGYLDNGSQDTRRRSELVKDKGGHFAAFNTALRSSLLDEDGITKLDYGHTSGEKAVALGWFRQLVRFCIAENIKIYILISPVHAQWLEMMWQMKIWDDYEHWKRDITRIVEAALIESEIDKSVELWDFSGYNSVSMEQVPAAGDTISRMHWYWEASHYTRHTGDLMLDRVLRGIKTEYMENFGVRLSTNSIERHLRVLRDERQSYAKERPEEVDYIKELIADTLGN